jgi:hypothetical protein
LASAAMMINSVIPRLSVLVASLAPFLICFNDAHWEIKSKISDESYSVARGWARSEISIIVEKVIKGPNHMPICHRHYDNPHHINHTKIYQITFFSKTRSVHQNRVSIKNALYKFWKTRIFSIICETLWSRWEFLQELSGNRSRLVKLRSS